MRAKPRDCGSKAVNMQSSTSKIHATTAVARSHGGTAANKRAPIDPSLDPRWGKIPISSMSSMSFFLNNPQLAGPPYYTEERLEERFEEGSPRTDGGNYNVDERPDQLNSSAPGGRKNNDPKNSPKNGDAT